MCSREDVLREMRKEHSISNRLAKQNFGAVQRSEAQHQQQQREHMVGAQQ
jgi:hypothetical protein